MSKTNFDLTVLPPKKKHDNVKIRPIDPRLRCSDNKPTLMLFIGIPRSGKTTTLLNYLGSSQFTQGLYEQMIFIGASINHDPTMEKLIEYYGRHNAYDYISDDLIDSIVQMQMEQDEDDRTNLCIVIDDALSLSGFESNRGALTKLAGNYRHITCSQAGCGADHALSFLGQYVVPENCDFASTTKGVYQRFTSAKEVSSAKLRAASIYRRSAKKLIPGQLARIESVGMNIHLIDI